MQENSGKCPLTLERILMQKVEKMSHADLDQVVDFRIGNDEYAIQIDEVVEIINYRNPTVVPGSPDYIEGVVDLRGTVIPVLNLKKRLGVHLEGEKSYNHILIVKNNKAKLGISVEKVLEVAQISDEKIQKTQQILSRGDVEFLKGFCKISGRLVLLLDVSRLLSGRERELLNV